MSSSVIHMHWVTWVKPSLGFKGSLALKADDLPTELPLLPRWDNQWCSQILMNIGRTTMLMIWSHKNHECVLHIMQLINRCLRIYSSYNMIYFKCFMLKLEYLKSHSPFGSSTKLGHLPPPLVLIKSPLHTVVYGE